MDNILFKEHNKKFFDVIKFSHTRNLSNSLASPEKVYKKVFRHYPDTVILINHKGFIDEVIIQSSNYLESINAFEINQSIFNSFPKSIHIRIYNAISNVIDNETPYSFQYSTLVNNNEYYAEVNFLPLNSKQIIVFSREITSKIIIQKALSHSENLFYSVWESSLDGLRLIKPNGEIFAVNNAYCKMIGIEATELIGRQFQCVYSGSSKIQGEIQVNISNKCSTEINIGECIETKLKLRDGRTVFVEVFNTRINPKNNDYSFINENNLILSIFRNITEKKLAQEKLFESQKIAGFGAMSAYITHELKTPLATIKMNLEILKSGNIVSTKKMRSVDLMLTEVVRLERLIYDVLYFSRNSELILVKINLNVLFQDIVQALSPIIEQKEIQIINNVTEIEIFGDYQKLYSAFKNLIQNSIEAIQSNGIIELESNNLKDKSGVRLYFKDNGCGIEERDKIYNPFFSTKANGTGLGLSIVKMIIEQHQGKIVLYTTSPSKTIFEIFLPCNA
jgi:PAS domain S-box-containing protein